MPSVNHQTVKLAGGRHSDPSEGVCVMELASMLAGEPFSDTPRSVSPSIAAVLRGLNDGLDDVRRQTLRRFASAAVGTAGDRATEQRRRRLIARSIAPRSTGRGALGWVSRAMTAAEPYPAACEVARRIAAGDEAEHTRLLALVDELVGMGRRTDGPADEAERVLSVTRAGAPGDRDCSR
jgi:hypothetical protein